MSGLPLFLRLAWRAFTTNEGRLLPLTFKRFLLQCLFVPALLAGWLLHSLAFLVDDLFFRGYRKIEVKEPVFVVGIARSGTTFLHRLLAEDTEHFTTFTYWELVLAPSIIERKLVFALARADQALGGLGRKLLVRFDRWLLDSFRKMHHLSLFEPEEDEWLLMHKFASAFLLFPFPFMSRVKHLLYFDAETPPAARKRIMAYYKRCVQRHLYVHGRGKRLLSKNPSFSAKIDSLNEEFPDSKIVCCVRNPYEAVPSFGSLMWFIWGQTPGQATATSEMKEALVEAVDHFYRHPMERLPLLPENRQAFVTYDQLIASPQKVITGLYARLQIEMTTAFAERLAFEQDKARSYQSSHAYSPEHYGLTRRNILEAYEDVFEHYGFSRD